MTNKPTYKDLEQRVKELEKAETVWKQNEEALRESEMLFRKYFDRSVAGMFAHRISDRGPDRAIHVNDSLLNMLGYSREEFLQLPLFEILEQEERDRAPLRIKELKEKGKLIFELNFVAKDGQKILSVCQLSLLDIQGQSLAIASVTDITDRWRTEDALLESEEKYRTILENIEEGYYEVDPAGNFTFVNDAMCKIRGQAKDELIGHNNRDFMSPETAKAVYKDFNKVYTTGKPAKNLAWKTLRADGSERYVESSVALMKNSEGQPIGFRGVVRDVTERQRIEEELRQSKKMEAIGTLAGGIAHDFNNLLSVIMVNLSLAEGDIKTEIGTSKFLKEAEKASMRAKELAVRLITFSKGGEPVKRTANIGELVKDSVNSLLSGSDIDCEFSIPEDLSIVEIDEVQMKQVVRNIVTNAQEAMAGKGAIKISAENVTNLEKGDLLHSNGKYVKISITDQGGGIPAENLTKIFDPYFSTKEMGTEKGMGLGLSICNSIVEKHNGLITVESELGVRTTFALYLPSISAKRKEPGVKRDLAQYQSKIANRQSSIQRVLLMDDEKMIRDFAILVLNRLGYDAEISIDGAEAIELYKKAKESGQPFDAVILDLTNQFGMGGKVAIEKLLEIDPDVKGIVSTGYSDDPVVTNFKKYGFSGALTKPYSIDELSKALKEIISREEK